MLLCNVAKGDFVLRTGLPSSRQKISFSGFVTIMRNPNPIGSSRLAGSRDFGQEHVDLRKGSPNSNENIGFSDFESTLNRMSKWIVVSLFGLNILLKHDIGALWAAMGLCVNSFLSIKLKRVLNYQRPTNSLKVDPGMPSSHAQNLFYGVVSANFSLLHWLGISSTTITLGTLILLFGSYLSWLRITQRLHTTEQVFVGALLGSSFGFLWFCSWHYFLFNACISYFWIQILVFSSSILSCAAFYYYIIRRWL